MSDVPFHVLKKIKHVGNYGYSIGLIKAHLFQSESFIFFLISARTHMLWYSLEAPHRGASNEYHNISFHEEIKKKNKKKLKNPLIWSYIIHVRVLDLVF